MTEYQKAKAVFDCWLCSLYIYDNIIKKKIPFTLFNDELSIYRKEGNIWKIKDASLTQDDVNTIAENLTSTTLGNCFVQLNSSLDVVFSAKPKSFPELYLTMTEGTLRMIIYMMRCAFAHNPALPVWEVKKSYAGVGVLNIPNKFQVDVTGMHGKPLHQNQHGGTEPLLRLMNYCLDVIKRNESA